MKTISLSMKIGICENQNLIFAIKEDLTEEEIKNYMKEWIWDHFSCEIKEVNPNPMGELQDKKALEERIMGTVCLEDGEEKNG